jgi:hypothetical protein
MDVLVWETLKEIGTIQHELNVRLQSNLSLLVIIMELFWVFFIGNYINSPKFVAKGNHEGVQIEQKTEVPTKNARNIIQTLSKKCKSFIHSVDSDFG